VKPIIQRTLAQADIVRAFDHYLVEATADVARALVLEIEASLRSIPGRGIVTLCLAAVYRQPALRDHRALSVFGFLHRS
jgi:plasmid stabilization system protein ParE